MRKSQIAKTKGKTEDQTRETGGGQRKEVLGREQEQNRDKGEKGT